MNQIYIFEYIYMFMYVFCAVADEWQMHFMNLLNFIIGVSLMRVSNKHINVNNIKVFNILTCKMFDHIFETPVQ